MFENNIVDSIISNIKTIFNYKKEISDDKINICDYDNVLITNLPVELMDKINILNNYGVKFELKNNPEYKFKIKSDELIFPICCVGKNRSQYLFYFFKYFQTKFTNPFYLGYPASGDELSTIYNPTSTFVLGGFIVPYKSDCFSKSIESTFGKEISRSIHVFDSIIRNPEPYLSNELANLEINKYRVTSLDIYNSESNLIKKLYIKYYLNPNNIRNILSNEYLLITWICLSPESLEKLIKLLCILKQADDSLDLSNTRIIYFGFNDIFQGSKVNKIQLDKLNQCLINSFVFECKI
jgi:hypothetical protein